MLLSSHPIPGDIVFQTVGRYPICQGWTYKGPGSQVIAMDIGVPVLRAQISLSPFLLCTAAC
jgi:hypothetical protein